MNLFYCPQCNKEETKLPENAKKTIINWRDGYGRIITHYCCPNCGNLLAGYVPNIHDKEFKEYMKSIIKDYNIGGLYFDKGLLEAAQKYNKLD
jgi:ssDNA-binding Zn-finger/Zn-ribbon topoisomerase 1